MFSGKLKPHTKESYWLPRYDIEYIDDESGQVIESSKPIPRPSNGSYHCIINGPPNTMVLREDSGILDGMVVSFQVIAGQHKGWERTVFDILFLWPWGKDSRNRYCDLMRMVSLARSCFGPGQSDEIRKIITSPQSDNPSGFCSSWDYWREIEGMQLVVNIDDHLGWRNFFHILDARTKLIPRDIELIELAFTEGGSRWKSDSLDPSDWISCEDVSVVEKVFELDMSAYEKHLAIARKNLRCKTNCRHRNSEKSSIRPIETRYAGFRFRSRLEARWAVFFDALGIKWEYELEGFHLKNGGMYLPDFWLPDWKVFCEVKPENGSLKKAESLAIESGRSVWCCVGSPSDSPYVLLVPNGNQLHRKMIQIPCDSAINAARGARFEHGESPSRKERR